MSIFKDLHIIRTKRNTVATSTPVKLMHPVDQSPFFEWPSPLGPKSNESHSPNSLTNKPHEAVKPVGQKTKSSEKSVNHLPEPYDESDDFVANTADVGLKSQKFKQFRIVESDEEDGFLKNRKSDTQKKKKNVKRKSNETATQPDVGVKKAKKIDPVRSAPNFQETDSESISNGYILPKITNNNNRSESTEEKRLRVEKTPYSLNKIDPSKNSLKKSEELEKNHPRVVPGVESLDAITKETGGFKISKKRSKVLEEDAPPEDSEAPNNVARRRTRTSIVRREEETVIRRSNRKRCKPLEFWNGERQEIDTDFTLSLDKIKKPRKKVSELKANGEQVNSIEQSEATDSNDKDVGRRKSILKSETKSGKKTSVKFSPSIETYTPAAGKSEKIDWVKNFDQLSSKQKLKSDCVTLPGLSTAGGNMSSSVIQIRPEAMKKGRTLHSHDLIFCLMIGAVTVTVRKTSAKIESYGHFAVPGGVSYCIKNTGSESAVLSCFKVLCESR